MWHPFDLIPDVLAVAPELRNAKPSFSRTVSFEERALTYFKDKSSKTGQWPLTMDELPGVQITRRGSAERCELDVRHSWHLDYRRTLAGAIQCSGNWSTPDNWSFLRTFKPMFQGAKPFDPVEVRGSRNNGELLQTHSGSGRRQSEQIPALVLLSTYALMAGFPVEEREPFAPLTLLGEDLMPLESCRICRSPDQLQNHPLAEGLSGYLVDGSGDFPTEFWVNKNGVTVYVFNSVSKVFVLTGVEGAG